MSTRTADLHDTPPRRSPGPLQPLYLVGARLLEGVPGAVPYGQDRLGVGALSYAGQFNVMAVADQVFCPDLGVFAAARDELRALATSTRATPDRQA